MTAEAANNIYVEGRTGPWEVVIGLEVHAQVTSNAKLFSGASTEFGADPNSQVSLVDAGFPGMLPVINDYCVRQAVKTGLGLHAQINLRSVFDRKNYFYPDLPQGYQISQYKHPIVGEGHLAIDRPDGSSKTIRIERIHLEQDAGKSIHDQHPSKTFIDLNRSGVALMEIVTKPDISSREEAMEFVKNLRSLLRYLGTCDGNMEQGSMRADVNVSLRRPGAPFGTRAEVKNVNSIRFMGQAIDYEVQRQMEILENGGVIDQETRLFDPVRGETRSMRSKEEAHDYRYFPDPDLPPLVIEASLVEEIRKMLPELPDAKRRRFVETLGLSPYDAAVLVADGDYADYYENALSEAKKADDKTPKLLANWITSELFGAMNRDNVMIQDSKVTPAHMAELVDLITDGTISGRIAKDVFLEMWESGKTAPVIVKEKGLEQVSDDSAIRACLEQILKDNADKVEEYRSGKDKLFGFFIGQAMKAMQGKANPQMLNDVLKQMLDGK